MPKRTCEDITETHKKKRLDCDPFSRITEFYVREQIFQHLPSCLPLLEVSKSWNEIVGLSPNGMENITINVNSENYQDVAASDRHYQNLTVEEDVGEDEKALLIQKFSRSLKKLKLRGFPLCDVLFETRDETSLQKIQELSIYCGSESFSHWITNCCGSKVVKVLIANTKMPVEPLAHNLKRWTSLKQLRIFNSCDGFLARADAFKELKLDEFGFAGVIDQPEAMKTLLLSQRDSLQQLEIFVESQEENETQVVVFLRIPGIGFVGVRIRNELSEFSADLFRFVARNLPNLQGLLYNDEGGDAFAGILELYNEMLDDEDNAVNRNIRIQNFHVCDDCLCS